MNIEVRIHTDCSGRRTHILFSHEDVKIGSCTTSDTAEVSDTLIECAWIDMVQKIPDDRLLGPVRTMPMSLSIVLIILRRHCLQNTPLDEYPYGFTPAPGKNKVGTTTHFCWKLTPTLTGT